MPGRLEQTRLFDNPGLWVEFGNLVTEVILNPIGDHTTMAPVFDGERRALEAQQDRFGSSCQVVNVGPDPMRIEAVEHGPVDRFVN